jgi:hypothetical protein
VNLSSVNGITTKRISKAALSALKEDSDEENKDDGEWDMVLNSTGDVKPKPVNMLKAIEETEKKEIIIEPESSPRLSQEGAQFIKTKCKYA